MATPKKTKSTVKATAKKSAKTTESPKAKAKPSRGTKSSKSTKASAETNSNKTLVIVESPAKAKTINKYLGKNYNVVASMGHVIDLPKSRLGVDIKNNFEPEYIIQKGKASIVNNIKKLAGGAKQVLLASDEDREGEAISWHIKNAIIKAFPDKDIKRIIFHEITKEAIQESIKKPGDIDLDKVSAQKARRVLDRIVGYNISPILWKKVKSGLSAGRVQSVALKLISDREAEINAFVPKEYWLIDASFEKDKKIFKCKLAKYDGKNIEVNNEKEATSIVAELQKQSFAVSSVRQKKRSRRPDAPYTTSKLQQDSANKLGFHSQRTMSIAQGLYEGVDLGTERAGLITYMRTDSVRVSDSALNDVRNYINTSYGKKYLPDKPNTYPNKKSAQDAHEAIRPTSVLRHPDSIKSYLTPDQFKLYDLIWRNFVSSQMTPADYDQLEIEITGGKGLFRVTSSKLVFDGFLKVSIRKTESEGETVELPDLKEKDAVKLNKLDPSQHFTEPPPRYTDASIVKILEELGIGRPSTYAPTITTLTKRGYVNREKKSLIPTQLGDLTNKIVSENFPDIINVNFTADLETKLDDIEEQKTEWTKIIKTFYDTFSPTLEEARSKIADMKGILDEETDEICEKCGSKMMKKTGRFGPFLACSGFPECKNTKPLAKDGSQVQAAVVEETDEVCDKCGKKMVKRTGRFGPFLACSDYPTCKNTKPIPLGHCPKCDTGMVVEKRASKKKFYGCSNYPKCDFVSWVRPKFDDHGHIISDDEDTKKANSKQKVKA